MAKLVGLVSSVLFSVYAARHLGVLGYGQYSFIIVFISYFSFLSEFGLDWVVTRNVATDRSRVKTFMAGAIPLRACTSLLAMVLAWGSFLFFGKPEQLPLVLIVSSSLITSSLTGIFYGAFQGFERMEYTALIDIPYSVVRSALSILVLACGGGLGTLFLCQLGVDVLRTFCAIAVYVTKIDKLSIHWGSAFLRHLTRSALPLMLWRLFTLVEQRIYYLLMAFFVGEIVIGWYAASARFVDMVSMLTVPAADALLPLLSRLFVESKERFLAAAIKVLRYTVIIFVPVAVGISILAQPLILWLYKIQYINSAPALQYLAWLALLLPCRCVLGTMLVAIRDWKVGALLQALAAIIALTSGLVLIPVYRHVGAAQAFLFTEAIMTLVSLAYLSFSLNWRPLGTAGMGWLKFIGLWTAVGLFLYLFRAVNIVFLIPLSMVGYIVGLFLLGAVTGAELSAVKQGLPRRLGRLI